jgi:hypothetical protein
VTGWLGKPHREQDQIGESPDEPGSKKRFRSYSEISVSQEVFVRDTVVDKGNTTLLLNFTERSNNEVRSRIATFAKTMKDRIDVTVHKTCFPPLNLMPYTIAPCEGRLTKKQNKNQDLFPLFFFFFLYPKFTFPTYHIKTHTDLEGLFFTQRLFVRRRLKLSSP